jgi:deoxyribodipyrimidine photo-lyase
MILLQLQRTGRLHGYVRAYWAKRLLEWSVTPASALAVCSKLNDRWALDGSCPAAVAGVARSVLGVHDSARDDQTDSPLGKVHVFNAMLYHYYTSII